MLCDKSFPDHVILPDGGELSSWQFVNCGYWDPCGLLSKRGGTNMNATFT